jgi:hypothetical protein
MYECKFCLESDNLQNLICPCDCNGSIKYVHEKCLKDYVFSYQMKSVCDVCKYEYSFNIKNYSIHPICQAFFTRLLSQQLFILTMCSIYYWFYIYQKFITKEYNSFIVYYICGIIIRGCLTRFILFYNMPLSEIIYDALNVYTEIFRNITFFGFLSKIETYLFSSTIFKTILDYTIYNIYDYSYISTTKLLYSLNYVSEISIRQNSLYYSIVSYSSSIIVVYFIGYEFKLFYNYLTDLIKDIYRHRIDHIEIKNKNN